ncbi:MAG: cleavage protein [Desulfitobacteriaceae bacterium]|nr:cleavage protein [Desulfitobacteriaceae bacterium]MDI6880851.1 cleavage protein [Desulfitobacteriaceae bacterium]MDI6915903.1 cleavage protein [Desulfitobacteriaceae bacterium]
MTERLCRFSCMYAVDGRCRLEHRHGERGAVCPHYEANSYGYLGGGVQ